MGSACFGGPQAPLKGLSDIFGLEAHVGRPEGGIATPVATTYPGTALPLRGHPAPPKPLLLDP